MKNFFFLLLIAIFISCEENSLFPTELAMVDENPHDTGITQSGCGLAPYFTSEICRGNAVQEYEFMYSTNNCGSPNPQDGLYNIYISDESDGSGAKLVNLGDFYMSDGIININIIKGVPNSFSKEALYYFVARRKNDDHLLNLGDRNAISVTDCAILFSGTVQEKYPDKIIWIRNFFDLNGTLSIKIKRASDNTTLKVFASAFPNTTDRIDVTMPEVTSDTHAYIEMSDGYFTYTSNPVIIKNIDPILYPDGQSDISESRSIDVDWRKPFFSSNVNITFHKYTDNSQLKVLATNTPNDGLESVTLPEVTESFVAYIKISDGTNTYISNPFNYNNNCNVKGEWSLSYKPHNSLGQVYYNRPVKFTVTSNTYGTLTDEFRSQINYHGVYFTNQNTGGVLPHSKEPRHSGPNSIYIDPCNNGQITFYATFTVGHFFSVWLTNPEFGHSVNEGLSFHVVDEPAAQQ